METINIARRCPVCQRASSVTVDVLGYLAWTRGKLIQQALPTLSREDRETLISGFCAKCQEEFFKAEE